MIEPVNQISEMCRALGIGLYKYSINAELIKSEGLGPLLSARGFVYQTPHGKLMIFFDASQSCQEVRYTIAHELGHIFQGHFREGRTSLCNPVIEREADSTAAVLMDLIYGPGWEEQLHGDPVSA